jgi:RsiW-degrading membrane proteinase PrsW (M82 family)
VTIQGRRPSALAESPLARPVFRTWSIVILILVLGVGALVIARIIRGIDGGWAVAGLATVIGLAAAVPAIVLLRYLDRREPEEGSLLLIAFLWGALAATGIAVVLNGFFGELVVAQFNETAGLVDTSRFGYELLDIDQLFRWLRSAFVAPYVEEAVKGVALIVLVLLARTEFTSMRDGIVYGGFIGLGFAVAEYVVFTVQGYGAAGTADYAAQFVPRFVLFGVSGHALYTALFGASVGWVRQTDLRRIHQVLVLVSGYLLAAAGHAISNAFAPFALGLFASLYGFDPNRINVVDLWILDLSATLAVNLWVYVLLVLLVLISGYWEMRVCREELAAEIGQCITPEEYRLVEDERLFRLRRLPELTRRQSADLVRAQNELAFRRYEVRRAGGDPAADGLTQEWRERVALLREEAASASTVA